MPKTAPALTLTAFRALPLEAPQAGAELPKSLLVHPWGAHDVGSRGRSIVSARTLAGFSASQAALKLTGHVALDFRHNTVPGTPAYLADKEPRKVAAYGVPKVVDGEGIFLTDLTWTPEGRDAYLGGHFRDLSPAVFRDKAGNVVALHSAALCDHGEIDGLTIEAATAPASLAGHFAALSASLSIESPPPMKPTPSLITLLALLGTTLAPEADEATLDKALTDLIDKIKAEKENGKPSDMTALTADFDRRLKAVEAERDQSRRNELKAQAIAAGKVIPLDDAAWNLTPLSVCASLVAGLPAGVVPMTAKTAKTPETASPDAFTADALEVFRRMGVTPEEVRQHNPA